MRGGTRGGRGGWRRGEACERRKEGWSEATNKIGFAHHKEQQYAARRAHCLSSVNESPNLLTNNILLVASVAQT